VVVLGVHDPFRVCTPKIARKAAALATEGRPWLRHFAILSLIASARV
jgi:hypothetical protein